METTDTCSFLLYLLNLFIIVITNMIQKQLCVLCFLIIIIIHNNYYYYYVKGFIYIDNYQDN